MSASSCRPAALADYGYFDAAQGRRLVEKLKPAGARGEKDNMAFVGVLSTQLLHHVFIEDVN